MDEEPLIYTSKGNLPQSSLRYEKEWQVTDQLIRFEEKFFLGDELVRNNVHMYATKGLPPIGGEQAAM